MSTRTDPVEPKRWGDEKEAEFLAHLTRDHPGVVDWAATPPANRGQFHRAIDHDHLRHTHTLTFYLHPETTP